MFVALSVIDILSVMLPLVPNIKIENRIKIDVYYFSYNLILSGLILSLVCSVSVIVLVGQDEVDSTHTERIN